MIPGKTEVKRRRNRQSWRIGVQWESDQWAGAKFERRRYTRVWIDLLCWTWIVTRFHPEFEGPAEALQALVEHERRKGGDGG